MVTQCTACLVWFRVTREQLHAAHGLVRCSACNTVFNALATLRHDMPEGAVLGGSASPVREEAAYDSGMSPSRESEASEFEVEKKDAGPTDEQPGGMAYEEDTAREASRAPDDGGPPDEEGPYLGMPADEPDAAAEASGESKAWVFDELPELELYLGSVLADDAERDRAVAVARKDREKGWEQTAPVEDDELEGVTEVVAPEPAYQPEEPAGQEGGYDVEPLPAFTPSVGSRKYRKLWGVAVAVAALVLAGQIVYAQRDSLGRIFGLPPAEPALHQYAITGATLDAAQQPGALVLKGALMNQGHRAQPLPLIRVTLTDRYGDEVGALILSPRQYGAGRKTLLHAHRRFMFHVKLADPGSSAVGFSLVLCKHHRHSILCQDS